MAHYEINDIICAECKKHFKSQNPVIKNGEVVCWDCSDYTIMGTLKEGRNGPDS